MLIVSKSLSSANPEAARCHACNWLAQPMVSFAPSACLIYTTHERLSSVSWLLIDVGPHMGKYASEVGGSSGYQPLRAESFAPAAFLTDTDYNRLSLVSWLLIVASTAHG